MQYAPTNDRVRLLDEFIHPRPDTLTRCPSDKDGERQYQAELDWVGRLCNGAAYPILNCFILHRNNPLPFCNL